MHKIDQPCWFLARAVGARPIRASGRFNVNPVGSYKVHPSTEAKQISGWSRGVIRGGRPVPILKILE
jgi:hypothetical protein